MALAKSSPLRNMEEEEEGAGDSPPRPPPPPPPPPGRRWGDLLSGAWYLRPPCPWCPGEKPWGGHCVSALRQHAAHSHPEVAGPGGALEGLLADMRAATPLAECLRCGRGVRADHDVLRKHLKKNHGVSPYSSEWSFAARHFRLPGEVKDWLTGGGQEKRKKTTPAAPAISFSPAPNVPFRPAGIVFRPKLLAKSLPTSVIAKKSAESGALAAAVAGGGGGMDDSSGGGVSTFLDFAEGMMYPCPQCPRVYEHMTALCNHLARKHKDKERQVYNRFAKDQHLSYSIRGLNFDVLLSHLRPGTRPRSASSAAATAASSCRASADP